MGASGPAASAAADEAVPLPADAVEVGRIVGAWGIKGAFRVQPFAADAQALFSSKRWFLQPPVDAPRPPGLQRSRHPAANWPQPLRIVQAREHGDAIVASAHDIADRDAAESLKGARVFVARASFPTPDADEFYWVDLIGLSVSNREGRALGRVVGLIETGPHCVLRIAPPAADAAPAEPPPAPAEERLIPFVSAYVDQVDLAGGRLVVDWLDDY